MRRRKKKDNFFSFFSVSPCFPFYKIYLQDTARGTKNPMTFKETGVPPTLTQWVDGMLYPIIPLSGLDYSESWKGGVSFSIPDRTYKRLPFLHFFSALSRTPGLMFSLNFFPESELERLQKSTVPLPFSLPFCSSSFTTDFFASSLLQDSSFPFSANTPSLFLLYRPCPEEVWDRRKKKKYGQVYHAWVVALNLNGPSILSCASSLKKREEGPERPPFLEFFNSYLRSAFLEPFFLPQRHNVGPGVYENQEVGSFAMVRYENASLVSSFAMNFNDMYMLTRFTLSLRNFLYEKNLFQADFEAGYVRKKARLTF